MKKSIILLLLLSFRAMAFFPEIDVKSISGKYIDGKGSAFAHSAMYNLDVVKISHENIEVKFNIVSKNLVLNDKNTTVKLKYDFSFLNFLKAATFDSLNIDSTSKKFEANAPEINIFIAEDKVEMLDMSVLSDLDGVTVNSDGDIDIFSGILINGQVETKKIRMRSVNLKELYDDIVIEHPELKDESLSNSLAKIPLVIRNLKLNLKDSKLVGSALLDSWINAWVNVRGEVENNMDENQIKIKLTKAKLGIFSVKRILLKRLRKTGIKGVSVQGSTIIIDLQAASN